MFSILSQHFSIFFFFLTYPVCHKIEVENYVAKPLKENHLPENTDHYSLEYECLISSRASLTILIFVVLSVVGVLDIPLAAVLGPEDLEDGEDGDCEDHSDGNHHAEFRTGGLPVVFLIK